LPTIANSRDLIVRHASEGGMRDKPRINGIRAYKTMTLDMCRLHHGKTLRGAMNQCVEPTPRQRFMQIQVTLQ